MVVNEEVNAPRKIYLLIGLIIVFKNQNEPEILRFESTEDDL